MPPKVKRARGNAWSDEETKCLLGIWTELHIQSQLDSASTTDTVVYTKVSKAMKDSGFVKSAIQCRERMKTLKRTYRTCRDKLKTSGQSRTLCKYYNELNEILEDRPSTSPTKVIQSMVSEQVMSDFEIDTDSNHDAVASEDDEIQSSVVIDSNVVADDEVSDSEIASRVEATTSQVNTTVGKGKYAASGKTKPKGKGRKSRLEVTLNTVMDKFTKSNETIESQQIDIEKHRLQYEMKKLDDEAHKRDFELKRLDREEKQKSADRDHQLRMFQMLMDSRPQRPNECDALYSGTSSQQRWQPYYSQQSQHNVQQTPRRHVNESDEDEDPCRRRSHTINSDGHTYMNM